MNLSTRLKKIEDIQRTPTARFCAGKHGNSAGCDNRNAPFRYSLEPWSIGLPFTPPAGIAIGERVETKCQTCNGAYMTIYQPFTAEA